MRYLLPALVLGASMLLGGCGSPSAPGGGSPDDPVTYAPGDPTSSGGPSDLLPDTTGDSPFFLDGASVRVAESFPVQLFLEVSGSAPTPCHRVAYTVAEKGDEISVTITTTSDGQPCAQVLHPLKVVIPLGRADLPVTVVVNDGEFVETVRP